MQNKDYYSILELKRTASAEEIREAYKAQALKWLVFDQRTRATFLITNSFSSTHKKASGSLRKEEKRPRRGHDETHQRGIRDFGGSNQTKTI